MRIAIVGCGFVADYYLKTLPRHPSLELVGVMDRDQSRSERFSTYHAVESYRNFEDLLNDPRVDLVLNLTNPHSHYEVSKACLEAGKHVYSEKPLATNFTEAKALVELAERRGLYLSSAPCNLLSETAQGVWRALQEKVVGEVRLVYAEMDDGMVHRMPYDQWYSESGIPWPFQDEFEVGCTLEHAAYYITWLVAFFGPVETVTAFSDCLIPDKQPPQPLTRNAPDFSVACLKFRSGVVARLTCGIVAPHDHQLRIIGDTGVLSVKDCWFYRSPIHIQRPITIRRRQFWNPWKQRYPLPKGKSHFGYRGAQQMDFARGVAALATAIQRGEPGLLSARYCLHVNEVVLAIQDAGTDGSVYRVTTPCEAEPLLASLPG